MLFERNKEDEIAVILSKTLKFMIENDLDYELFHYYCEVMGRLHLEDYPILGTLFCLFRHDEKSSIADDNHENPSFKRLEYEGLIKPFNNVITYPGSSLFQTSYSIRDKAKPLGEVLAIHYKLEDKINVYEK